MADLIRYFSVLSLILIFPSLKLSYFKRVEIPLPESLKPGEALVFEESRGLKNIRYRGLPLTRLNEPRSSVAWVSLYDGPKAQVTGHWDNENPSSFWSFLVGRPQEYFSQSIPIKEFHLERAPALKVSEEVWKKVSTAQKQNGSSERATIQNILSKKTENLIAESCFNLPLDSTVISGYGSPRTLPNGRKYHHTGIDLRARSPLKLLPMGPGRIVYAGHMSVSGNMVIVDHGGFIHSRYMHLSQIDVKEGDEVTSDTLIGKTGRTGRITGPHLHWEVLWHGRAIDPIAMLQSWATVKSCPVESNEALSSYQKVAQEIEEQMSRSTSSL